MQEESPEGGRFKKEIVVDGQSYLLLIRDEGGPPELQVIYAPFLLNSLFSLKKLIFRKLKLFKYVKETFRLKWDIFENWYGWFW